MASELKEPLTGLNLYNSLTRRKEPFIPSSGLPKNPLQVLWYSCGPTVYDASHMGHARSYISFDILRRVMRDYFKFEVQYIMNITDIDDKIIKRARQEHLFAQYVARSPEREQVLSDLKETLQHVEGKFAREEDKDKKKMYGEEVKRLQDLLAKQAELEPSAIAAAASDVLGDLLDRRLGRDVRGNEVFTALPRRWEEAFHADMKRINVEPPDVLTRVSEYLPEIVRYIERIIASGFAYLAPSGSVYFDTVRYASAEGHRYAKLVPEAVGDLKLVAEGEGDLSVSEAVQREKRSAADFALWKASKAGEPAWPSPWGEGRPGWHIECSVMSSAIAGDRLDVHSGGVDLKFPHHDNEIAQSEAALGANREWVGTFLHSGHLTIAGCKMAKSLKNFVTIADALNKYSARQIRLLFLASPWNGPLDYSPNTMNNATTFEGQLSEFFLNVKAVEQQQASLPEGTATPLSAPLSKFSDLELALVEKFTALQAEVHQHICDNVDTPKVVASFRELINESNVYMQTKRGVGAIPHGGLLRRIALYMTRLLDLFGVPGMSRDGYGFVDVSDSKSSYSSTAALKEEILLPPLQALCNFRESVRSMARETLATKGQNATELAKKLLDLSDQLRDDVLPDLGIKLEDFQGQPSAIKLVDKEILQAERAERIRERNEIERKREERLRAQAAKEALLRISPQDLFRREKDKYSDFDENGIPIKDASGKELTKAQQNKLRSEQKKHEEKHRKWMQQQQSAGLHTSAAGVASDELVVNDEGDGAEATTLPTARPLGAPYTDWLKAGIRDAPHDSSHGLKDEN